MLSLLLQAGASPGQNSTHGMLLLMERGEKKLSLNLLSPSTPLLPLGIDSRGHSQKEFKRAAGRKGICINWHPHFGWKNSLLNLRSTHEWMSFSVQRSQVTLFLYICTSNALEKRMAFSIPHFFSSIRLVFKQVRDSHITQILKIPFICWQILSN